MGIGDIYIIKFPSADSHEQEGIRPAVIIIDFPELPIAQIVPLTTNLKAKRFKNILIIEPDNDNNLNHKSIALLFQLRAIDKKRLDKKIGKLINEDIKKLKDGLKSMLKL